MCKGYRASVYRAAQNCFGYYSDGGSIYFDGSSVDLTIRVWFEEKGHALQFQNELSSFAENHSRFKEKLQLCREVLEKPPPLGSTLRRIMGEDYNPADNNDSPVLSLNDVLSNGDSQVSVAHDPSYALQSLENVSAVSSIGSKWYKCHLVSRKEKDKSIADHKDNVIYESWTFHQLFDGLNTTDGIGVLVQFDRFASPLNEQVLVASGKYETRQKLFVIVVFRTADIATIMGAYLKDGTEKLDECRFRSFLYARDADKMKEFLNMKYEASLKLWLSSSSSSSSSSMLDDALIDDLMQS